MLIGLWAFDFVALVYLLLRCKAERYQMTIREALREQMEERKLRKLWKKEIG